MLLVLIIIVAMISQNCSTMVVHFINVLGIISWEVIRFFISLTLLLNSHFLSTIFIVMISIELLALIWESTLFKVYDILSVQFIFLRQSFLFICFIMIFSPFSQDFK